MRTLLILSALLLTGMGTASSHVLCRGFLPPNNLKIPVRPMQVGGISQTDFNDILDHIQSFYGPRIAAKGGNLVINRDWNDQTVNASAEQQGGDWILNMYGGLARYPNMTKDAYYLVVCHETGHHMGGAPKGQGMWGQSDWASNEGQADYYATLDCMRYMFNDDRENADFVNTHTIDATLKQTCVQSYTTQAEQNLCMREGTAALVVADIFQDLDKIATAPSFATPDPSVVKSTDDNHPAPQCRLDTYFDGSVCVHDTSVELSNTDPSIGTCMEPQTGHRPRCWYAP